MRQVTVQADFFRWTKAVYEGAQAGINDREVCKIFKIKI